MTEEGINEAVAVKLGWTAEKMGDPYNHLFYGYPEGERCDCGRIKHSIPDYCHSISAAWEIVEYLAKPNTGFVFGLNWRGDEGWWCKMEFGHMYPDIRVFETGDTAPMAICRAFLSLPSAVS